MKSGLEKTFLKLGSFHKLRLHLGVGRWSEKHLKCGFANRTKSEEKSVQLDRGSFVPIKLYFFDDI